MHLDMSRPMVFLPGNLPTTVCADSSTRQVQEDGEPIRNDSPSCQARVCRACMGGGSDTTLAGIAAQALRDLHGFLSPAAGSSLSPSHVRVVLGDDLYKTLAVFFTIFQGETGLVKSCVRRSRQAAACFCGILCSESLLISLACLWPGSLGEGPNGPALSQDLKSYGARFTCGKETAKSSLHHFRYPNARFPC